MKKEDLLKALDNCEFATINVVILEKFGCLMIPEKKWTEVSNALYDQVGDDGWNDDWDY